MLDTTLAKRYAHALFDIMPEKKNLFLCLEDLDKNVLTPHDFWDNPCIERTQYLEFFKVVGKPFRLPKNWTLFGNLLLDHKRLSLMPLIIKEYLFLCEKNTHIIITTALPFSTQHQQKLLHWVKKQLGEKMGRKVTSTFAVNEDLLAGFKVEGDTFVYDGSLKNSLHNLEKALL